MIELMNDRGPVFFILFFLLICERKRVRPCRLTPAVLLIRAQQSINSGL